MSTRDNEPLFDALQSTSDQSRRVQLIDFLGDVVTRVLDANDLETIAEVVDETFKELISVQYGALYLFDEKEQRLTQVWQRGFSEEAARIAEQTAMERHPGEVYREGCQIHIPDVPNDPESRTETSPRESVVRSRLFFPVQTGGTTVGSLGLAASEREAFSQDHVAVMSFYARLIGAAYGRLRHEQQQRRARTRISRFNETLRAIRDISQLMVRERDPDRIWQSACERLVSTASYACGCIVSREADGTMRVDATAPESIEPRQLESRLRSAGTIEPLVSVLDGEQHVVSWTGESFDEYFERQGEAIDRWVGVTLDYSGIVYGVLVLGSQAFDDAREKPILQGVANDIAFVTHMLTRESENSPIEERALRDCLTGLPNRTLFQSRLDHVLTRSERRETNVALLFGDLDDLKKINDNFGHEAGDRLLIQFARRLEDAAREADTVARIGGDEFTVLIEELAPDDDLEPRLERLIAQLDAPFEIQGRDVYSTASIGVVRYDELKQEAETSSLEAEDLLRAADRAMYRAKEQSTTEWRRGYPGDLQEGGELQRASQLRGAIEADNITAHFQPIVTLDDECTVGMEALARWEHREKGCLEAHEFLRLTQNRGLFEQVTRCVYQEACQRFEQWHRDVETELTLFLNVNPSQLGDSTWLAYLEEFALPPDQIVIELTEREIMQNATCIEQMMHRDFQLAIDDFGTGYSSLEYLKDLDVDVLKLDMAFIHGAVDDPTDRAILESVCRLSSKLNITVVAEGVETPQQAAVARETGCDSGQGFYYASPMPSERFEAQFVENDSSVAH